MWNSSKGPQLLEIRILSGWGPSMKDNKCNRLHEIQLITQGSYGAYDLTPVCVQKGGELNRPDIGLSEISDLLV
ncbi:hypothetical protein R1flu_011160 [Riccia fluitans]|uniref:Uncharacterized protein n=1 Tax=Riccia fluitans TaxID=41844 RepID=A0ABD1Z720_9MARC